MKAVKISKNLYHNLISRPGEKPRIELKSPNEGRVIFALAELLKARSYRVDASGFIDVDFKEIHGIFSEGRKRSEPSETVEAFSKLATRPPFNLVLRNGEGEGETLYQRNLFVYSGDFRNVKRIGLSPIFYLNIERLYYSFPANFLTILLEAARAIDGDGAKITRSDIILSLYVKQYSHTGRTNIKRTIRDMAVWSGMLLTLDGRQQTRISENIERSARVLKHLELIEGYSIENNNITLFLPVAPQARKGKRKH